MKNKKMNLKKALMIALLVLIILASMFLYFMMNRLFPNNVIHKIVKGISFVLTPLIIALIITYLVNPFANKLVEKFKFKRFWAVLCTITIFVIFIAVFLAATFIFIYQTGLVLYKDIIDGNLLDTIKIWMVDNGLESLYNAIKDFIVNFDYTQYFGKANIIISAIVQFLMILVLVPIFLWYFLMGKDNIFKSVANTFPESWHKHVNYLGVESNRMIISYFKSKVISMVFLFIVFVFVFIIFSMPFEYVLLFAALITLLDLIPYIGPVIGMIVPIIYIFSVQGTTLFFSGSNIKMNALISSVLLLGLNLIIQQIQNNVIMPKLAGKEMNISSLLILISMLFFGILLGLWGVLLSIPLCGFIIILYRYIKNDFKPVENFLDVEPEVNHHA